MRFDDRLNALEYKHTAADRARALFEFEHYGTLPDDPRFAAWVKDHHTRLRALGAEMEATVPDSREAEHPEASARRVSAR